MQAAHHSLRVRRSVVPAPGLQRRVGHADAKGMCRPSWVLCLDSRLSRLDQLRVVGRLASPPSYFPCFRFRVRLGDWATVPLASL